MELVCEAAVTLNDLKQCPSFMSSKILESGFRFFFFVYNEYFGGNFRGSFCLSKALTFLFFFFNFLHSLIDATLEVKVSALAFPSLFYFSEAVIVKVVTTYVLKS